MHKSWDNWIWKRSQEADFQAAKKYVKERQEIGIKTFPPNNKVMKVFNYDLNNIKVVILGQDPYHSSGQAHGLAFSVENKKPPSSLKNIFKEIEKEGFELSPDAAQGNLESWAKQGVFLLNCFLTVEEAKPKSHHKIGWESFTDSVIEYISDYHENIVFMLWGNFAKEKEKLIDTDKHLVLKSPHPSGFSANKGFFGNQHFVKANDFLIKNRKNPVYW